MKQKILLSSLGLIFVIFTFQSLQAQTKSVEAKGTGISRDDALQDALRNAIGQAVGVSISSTTEVENFMIIKDAIESNTRGYITNYEISSETKLQNGYEVSVKASVSLSPIKADAQLLARQIGGVRFLVMYDKRHVEKEKINEFEYAVDRINAYLSEKNYRYIEKSRFERLQEEAFLIMEDTDTSTMSFVQKLGLMSGAQFIILVDGINVSERSENFDTRTAARVVIETRVYDNCTAEGLGTVMLESNWNSSGSATMTGIDEAIDAGFEKVMGTFNSYIGNWVNNGTPYELRFYQVGTFRDFRDLRNKIKESPDFGGQFQITSVNNYTRLNATFKNVPDDIAFQILDFADAIPGFAEKELDVIMIYGRQISFAPREIVVPEIEAAKEFTDQ
ncbi:MAG: LPP20 family lipoprotein [Bacteroidales bacterium]|nr:LPP20 family lipoprotein [Bacteroidales bacterium]